MAVTFVRIPALQQRNPVVDESGRMTTEFSRRLNDIVQQIADAINAVIVAQDSADAAQQQALDALQQAIDALQAAVTAQQTADGKISKADADTYYVKRDGTATWSNPAATGSRGSLASYTAPTISNPPTQAEVQAVANATQALNVTVSALIRDLILVDVLKG